MLLPCHFSISLLSKFLCTFITGNKGPFLAKLTKDGDYEYVKSFYTGYDDDGKRGTGHVSCDKNGNLFFATNYVNSLSLGVRLLKQGLNPLVKVYPNPCRGTLNTGYISGVAGEIGIQVYNFFGQEVFATTKNTTPGNNTYTLDLSTLQPSMYFLSITKGQKTVATNKFIVKK